MSFLGSVLNSALPHLRYEKGVSRPGGYWYIKKLSFVEFLAPGLPDALFR